MQTTNQGLRGEPGLGPGPDAQGSESGGTELKMGGGGGYVWISWRQETRGSCLLVSAPITSVKWVVGPLPAATSGGDWTGSSEREEVLTVDEVKGHQPVRSDPRTKKGMSQTSWPWSLGAGTKKVNVQLVCGTLCRQRCCRRTGLGWLVLRGCRNRREGLP